MSLMSPLRLCSRLRRIFDGDPDLRRCDRSLLWFVVVWERFRSVGGKPRAADHVIVVIVVIVVLGQGRLPQC